ncbi:MAG: permease-like cell division protein FtsX, partial [Actinomycetota bacterium]
MRATFVTSEVGAGLRRNLTMTFAVIITVAVSLALFGVSLLVRAQVTTMQDFWYDKVEVSIFLCARGSDAASCASGAVTAAQRDQIRADLESLRPLVEEVYYESKEEAYERFREQFANSPIVENVTAEALPESFRVKLADPTQYDVVASAFAGRPGIEQVNDQRQILDKFFALLNGLQAVALIIAVVMLVVTVLLIVNTMRVAAFSRRRETGIMRLVGASNFYI